MALGPSSCYCNAGRVSATLSIFTKGGNMANCRTCGTECGADGIVTECRNAPPHPALTWVGHVTQLNTIANLEAELHRQHWRTLWYMIGFLLIGLCLGFQMGKVAASWHGGTGQPTIAK